MRHRTNPALDASTSGVAIPVMPARITAVLPPPAYHRRFFDASRTMTTRPLDMFALCVFGWLVVVAWFFTTPPTSEVKTNPSIAVQRR